MYEVRTFLKAQQKERQTFQRHSDKREGRKEAFESFL